jgi:hypothetical protein
VDGDFLIKILITEVTVVQEELLMQVALLVSIITFKTLLDVSTEQELVDVTSVEVMNVDVVGMASVIPLKNGWLYLKTNALKCFARELLIEFALMVQMLIIKALFQRILRILIKIYQYRFGQWSSSLLLMFLRPLILAQAVLLVDVPPIQVVDDMRWWHHLSPLPDQRLLVERFQELILRKCYH